MNGRTGLQDWISNPSRPSYGNQAEMEPLAENFWGAGQRQLFVKGLRKRGFQKHELDYIRTRGQPRDEDIVDEVLH